MDSFKPPADGSTTGIPTGRVDAGAALATGLSAAVGNAFQLLAVALWIGITTTVSCCGLVLWVVTYPMIFWGTARWALSAIDGEADLTLLWTSVLEDPMVVWQRGWAWFLLLFLAFIPLYAVMMPIGVMASLAQDLQTALLWALAQQALTGLFMLVIIRFYQSFWILVERRKTTMDAISEGWQANGKSWPALAGLTALWLAVNLPYQILISWQNFQLQQLPPAQMLDAMGTFYAIILGGASVVSVLGMAMLLVFAAAHRQLYPEPPAETV